MTARSRLFVAAHCPAAAPRRYRRCDATPHRCGTATAPRRATAWAESSDMPSVDESARRRLDPRAHVVPRGRPDRRRVACRDIILASWTRSREWNIDVDGAALSAFDTESDSLLVRAARPVLDSVTDELAGEPVSVILTDADGVVLERRTGDSSLSQALDRIWLAPGFSYSEKFVGTNGIGTALEGRGPGRGVRPRALRGAPGAVRLRGRARLAPGQRQAARRHRPDLLAPGRRTVHVHGASARIARQIESALLDQSGPARAGPAARLPDRLPPQQRRRVRRQPRPAS